MIVGATNATLDITEDGTYYAAVTSTGTCSSTIDSDTTVAVVPASFEIIVDFEAPYTGIGSSYD